MHYQTLPGGHQPLRAAIGELYHADEADCLRRLLDSVSIGSAQRSAIHASARELVEAIRAEHAGHGGLDAFLQEFELSSQEGVVLMCLAEALLRVPDAQTADALIRDKLSAADWEAHLGHSESLFVNASTWALMLTGRLVRIEQSATRDIGSYLRKLAQRSGEPVIRTAVTRAMRIMGQQFVLAENIGAALKKARRQEAKGFRYSYDMLGEAARTEADAQRYVRAYSAAIAAIGAAANGRGPIEEAGISVKLSALHPRYEFAKMQRVMDELLPRIRQLALQARALDIGLTIDAEEADRLEPSLSVLEALALDPELAGWNGLGLALQAYQKRAPAVIDWLAELARRGRRRLMVRLVKGAYWDAEIKRAQELGHADYPVFTRKVSTDVSYLACAQKLLAAADAFYPQFATHNAHSVAAVMAFADSAGNQNYEFQCLHGMGEALYEQVVGRHRQPCRIYAPVGAHKELLAYLVRRLLENGANSSFVNRLVDEKLPIDEIIADPLEQLAALPRPRHPRIPLPADIFGAERRNAAGVDISDAPSLDALRDACDPHRQWRAAPLVAARATATGAAADATTGSPLCNPADLGECIGSAIEADGETVEAAIATAHAAAADWDRTPAAQRAQILKRAADLYETHSAELFDLCQREAGKTLNDAVAELREAVDFLRYYALRAEAEFSAPQLMPGPTGERNELSLHGRGAFACISPWNFPLAIFTGQLSAALAAGNAVLAKPAEQTPLIACRAVELLHRAGVPPTVLQCLPGRGEVVGKRLVDDARIAGVAFTGSTETARLIQRGLAARDGAIVPLIAETGGLNAMIVDSTALPEQVIRDTLISAFQSAGQRCSALRLLCLQADVADAVLEMLRGAMDELATGDPRDLATDLGPVIDADALQMLQEHLDAMRTAGHRIHRAPPPASGNRGHFFAPALVELDDAAQLQRELFGPILHVVRWRAADLDRLVDAINERGYGLTLGVHSRIDATLARVRARARVGNLYANRSTIGAVVGVQPFGGEGLSGTGPKAGGPRYLHRFACERHLSVDTTAAGGNASLLSLGEGAA